MTTDDETEAANRMQAAFEAVHEAVLRLLQEGQPFRLAHLYALSRKRPLRGRSVPATGA